MMPGPTAENTIRQVENLSEEPNKDSLWCDRWLILRKTVILHKSRTLDVAGEERIQLVKTGMSENRCSGHLER